MKWTVNGVQLPVWFFSPKLEQALPHNQCLYCIVRKNYFNSIYSLGIF